MIANPEVRDIRRRLQNVTLKVNLLFLKLDRAYSISFNSSNVSDFLFLSWILKDWEKIWSKSNWNTAAAVRRRFAPLIRTLRNYHGDCKENVQKAIGLWAKQQLCTCITLFCTFLCCLYTTTTWNDHILSLFENENGKSINSTISVWIRARSPLFMLSSNQNSLLLSNRANWNNREKV